ncbi:MAG TPA: hypothetical protein VFE38_10915 [Edaphobacter sp.]|nr:hypothetical protein [Edaphobacter sp.]
MKVFRCLFALIIACAFIGSASAEPIDFHMRVLDPPPPAFSVQPIFSTPFTFTFTACSVGELPGGGTADGCFAGVNRSGMDWSNLTITFADNPVLAGQTPSCALTGSNNIFSDTACSLAGSTYTLSFTDGVLSNNDFFFITEDGVVPPEGFGVGTGSVVLPTPEPEPFLLLATGLVLFGVVLKLNRQDNLRVSSLS